MKIVCQTAVFCYEFQKQIYNNNLHKTLKQTMQRYA